MSSPILFASRTHLDGFETREDRRVPVLRTVLAGAVPSPKKGCRVVAFSADELDGRDGAMGVMGVESSGSLYQTMALGSSNFPSVPTAHWSEGGMFRDGRSQDECSYQ